MNSHECNEPRSADSSVPRTGAASCVGPGAETGANGSGWRSGAREQFGPEHGTLGAAGSSAAAGAAVDVAWRSWAAGAFRTTT